MTPAKLFQQFKHWAFGPIFKFFKSEKGNNFMRRVGPIIVVLYYLDQLGHCFIFSIYFVKELINKYFSQMPISIFLFILIGYFLLYKAIFLYTKLQRTHPGKPIDLKKDLIENTSLPNTNIEIQEKYSYEISEILRYQKCVEYETLENITGLKCDKCREFKPLRTHHCSVCNQCVLVMDHHCMWTNTCIGLNNYKYYLQLLCYGILGCYYSTFVLYLIQDEQVYSDWYYTFTIVKLMDIVIGKLLLILFAWNMYVCSQGYTSIEFKFIMESSIKDKNQTFDYMDEEKKKQLKHLVLFRYGFQTIRENFARAFKTTNYVFGFLFLNWFEDTRLTQNGVEWTVVYYWNQIQSYINMQQSMRKNSNDDFSISDSKAI